MARVKRYRREVIYIRNNGSRFRAGIGPYMSAPLTSRKVKHLSTSSEGLEAILSETTDARGRRLLLAKWRAFPAPRATWELEGRFTKHQLDTWEKQKRQLEEIEQEVDKQDEEDRQRALARRNPIADDTDDGETIGDDDTIDDDQTIDDEETLLGEHTMDVRSLLSTSSSPAATDTSSLPPIRTFSIGPDTKTPRRLPRAKLQVVQNKSKVPPVHMFSTATANKGPRRLPTSKLHTVHAASHAANALLQLKAADSTSDGGMGGNTGDGPAILESEDIPHPQDAMTSEDARTKDQRSQEQLEAAVVAADLEMLREVYAESW